MTRSPAVERSPALGRVLADVERAAWAGDLGRARGLLRLAERLAGANERADVLVAAESVRSAAAAAGREPSSTVARGATPINPRRLPRLRALPEHVPLTAASATRPPPLAVSLPAAAPPASGGRRAVSRQVLAGVCAMALVAVATIGDGRQRFARYAVDVGRPDVALLVLGDAPGGGDLLLRGDARLAAGDTSGAVADYVGATEAELPGGWLAWDAGERLERLGGHDDAAAEALLRAYVLGIESSRWGRVAEALQRVGRREEALRVRDGTGR